MLLYVYTFFFIFFFITGYYKTQSISLCHTVGPCLSLLHSSVYLLEIYMTFIHQRYHQKLFKNGVFSLPSTLAVQDVMGHRGSYGCRNSGVSSPPGKPFGSFGSTCSLKGCEVAG